jgi:hypothetical protein
MLALDSKSHLNRTDKFSLELDLVQIFHEHLQASYSKKHIIEKEVNCDFGIADLVMFKVKNITNNNFNLSLISPDWAFSLRMLAYRKIFSTEDFCQLAGVSKNSAAQALREFCSAQYCEKISNNTWRKIKQPTLISDYIVSYEAKLKNWKRALWQACRYKTFSNESWVVLDCINEKPAIKNIQSFVDFNIGLVSVSKNGSVNVYYQPKEEQHQSDIALWKANALIARKLIQ